MSRIVGDWEVNFWLARHPEIGQALYRRFTEDQVQDTIVEIRS